MKEIFIDINGRSNDFIRATENDNNSDIYKIVLTENDRRIDLTNKTANMAYALNYSKDGDIMELNITNPTEGEITLTITDILTRKEGNYTCQIVILGEDSYRKHTDYFNLSIKENLFNKIASGVLEGVSFSFLQELVKRAETMKESLSEKILDADVKKEKLEKTLEKTEEFFDGLSKEPNRLFKTKSINNDLIARKSIGVPEADFLTCGKNLYDKNRREINRLLSGSVPETYNISESSNYDITDFIYVEMGKNYSCNVGARNIYLLNIAGECIEVITTRLNTNTPKFTFTASQTGYIRASLYKQSEKLGNLKKVIYQLDLKNIGEY